MLRTAIHRLLVVCTAVAGAVVALSVGAAASAAANTPPGPAATTVFPVPVTFVSACSTVGFRCWVPYQLAAVTPSATTGAPGAVTFTAEPSPTIATTTLDCIDVAVNWRNLTTGAVGTAVLRAVLADFSKPTTRSDWCRYTPATVDTGSGIVAATADVTASVKPPTSSMWPQVPVHAGLAVFQVP